MPAGDKVKQEARLVYAGAGISSLRVKWLLCKPLLSQALLLTSQPASDKHTP